MTRSTAAWLAAVIGLTCLAGCTLAAAAPAAERPQAPPCRIVSPAGATYAEALAAREVRRYVYLRTGRLLPIVESAKAAPGGSDLIIVATKDRPVARETAPDAALAALQPQHYLLKTVRRDGRTVVLVAGGDAAGTLYGTYRFAECLGVRFYLHGDVVPDGKMPLALPDVDETAKPLFETRGIQPFHDFPEGPDWWNADDYKAVISQLAKLRMNFIGLHTYPEGGPNAEPTVWIGLPEDARENADVAFSYPASYQNTLRGNWGYAAKKTSDFALGAAQLFERNAFGADVMADLCPQPTKPEDCNEVFKRTGRMLREAFEHAHRLGVRTCVGTETPLRIPAAVQQRLKEKGKDPKDPAVVAELYEGIFRRIAATYPLDYYWLWTPEGWTWGNAKDEEIQATLADLQTAVAAAAKAKAPFTLATCGWVLGPQTDRALFDKALPKNMPMSCINREVGKAHVEPGFANVAGRPKWSIPWMEDDPNLLMPQLWAGRMRQDAANALKYGCTGLLGIHWRTRVLGPNVAALARAAWDQKTWAALPASADRPAKIEGPIGENNVAHFPANPIEGTDDAPLYQDVRYNVSGYQLRMPNGTCTVTLKFCEPHYGEAGKRVFGVKIQGKQVIDRLDIFEKVGKNKALDYTFEGVEVADGWLDIDFVYQTEFPCIAAIAVDGHGYELGVKKHINCGGPAYKNYQADWQQPVAGPSRKERDAPIGDFYLDWARAEFGAEVAEPAARIFERIDGRLPEPSGWIDGPGGLKETIAQPAEIARVYGFVGEFGDLRPKVKGAGNLDRFDYWLHQFRYMWATELLKSAWGSKDEQAMRAALADAYGHLLATVSNPGELGTVANWEQHALPRLKLEPAKEYKGPARVIVPTVRTAIDAGETLDLKVIILAEKPPQGAALYHRPLGAKEFTRTALAPVARGVHRVQVTPAEDFEYYVEATPDGGDPVRWPPTAPAMNQTVIVMPRGETR